VPCCTLACDAAARIQLASTAWHRAQQWLSVPARTPARAGRRGWEPRRPAGCCAQLALAGGQRSNRADRRLKVASGQVGATPAAKPGPSNPRAARLRDVRVPLQAQARDEALRDGLPVHARVRGQVRVVVAHRARHLAVQRHRGRLRAGGAAGLLARPAVGRPELCPICDARHCRCAPDPLRLVESTCIHAATERSHNKGAAGASAADSRAGGAAVPALFRADSSTLASRQALRRLRHDCSPGRRTEMASQVEQ